jgi:hypothetical protein
MVPPNSSHEPVSACRDMEIMSSPNNCDIHHALSIIATQRRRDNKQITLSVQLQGASKL